LVAGELGEGVPLFGVGIDRASEEDLVPVPLISSAPKRLTRFRMRSFVRDVGRPLKLVYEGLLVRADLNCEQVRLEPLHSRMEQCSLRPSQAPEPPHSVDHTIHEEFLDRPYRREVCPNLIPEILEAVRVFSWEDDVPGEEAVPKRVETDGGFPLPRLWSRGAESVPPC
jgi:hypothetical protein